MAQIKYFQALADLMHPYQDFFMYSAFMLEDYYSENKRNKDEEMMLTSLNTQIPHYFRDTMLFDRNENISIETVERIKYEMNILSYMMGVRFDRYALEPLVRPEPEEVQALLRHIFDYYCKLYRRTPQEMYKHPNPIVKKMCLCCKHYIFQYSLPGYVNKLPEVIHGKSKDWRVPPIDMITYFLKNR